MTMTQQKPKQEEEVRPKYAYDEVLSFVGEPVDVYGGHALNGQKRKESMMAFMKGEDTSAWTYYYVPDEYYLSATKVEDKRLVHWPYQMRTEAGLV